MRGVAITGVGAVTPLGDDVATTWERLCAGACGLGEISSFDPDEAGLRARVAGEVPIDPSAHPAVDDRRMGRFVQLAMLAADEALADAGVRELGHADTGDASGARTAAPHDATAAGRPWDPKRVGVSIASGLGGQAETAALVGERPGPGHAIATLANMAAGHLGVVLGVRGPIRAPATACAAGSHAVIDAARDVAAGRADVMLAGGAEAPVSPVGVGQFDAMRALSTDDDPSAASRPFDADRDGFVVSEGAGVLVLEAAEHATARGAQPLGFVTGAATAGDGHHPAQPPEDARGLRDAIERALADAGPGDAGRAPTGGGAGSDTTTATSGVDWVCAHATGTPRGDAHEATALRAVFGDAVPPVTSVKGATGHALGAAGAIEAVLSVQALRTGMVPPTINRETPAPDCAVPVVTECRPGADPAVVLHDAAGFGGTNGVLVLAAPDGPEGAR